MLQIVLPFPGNQYYIQILLYIEQLLNIFLMNK